MIMRKAGCSFMEKQGHKFFYGREDRKEDQKTLQGVMSVQEE